MFQHIQGPQDVVVGNSQATPKGKSTKAIKTVNASSVENTCNVEDNKKTTMVEKRPNPRADGDLIGMKS